MPENDDMAGKIELAGERVTASSIRMTEGLRQMMNDQGEALLKRQVEDMRAVGVSPYKVAGWLMKLAAEQFEAMSAKVAGG